MMYSSVVATSVVDGPSFRSQVFNKKTETILPPQLVKSTVYQGTPPQLRIPGPVQGTPPPAIPIPVPMVPPPAAAIAPRLSYATPNHGPLLPAAFPVTGRLSMATPVHGPLLPRHVPSPLTASTRVTVGAPHVVSKKVTRNTTTVTHLPPHPAGPPPATPPPFQHPFHPSVSIYNAPPPLAPQAPATPFPQNLPHQTAFNSAAPPHPPGTPLNSQPPPFLQTLGNWGTWGAAPAVSMVRAPTPGRMSVGGPIVAAPLPGGQRMVNAKKTTTRTTVTQGPTSLLSVTGHTNIRTQAGPRPSVMTLPRWG